MTHLRRYFRRPSLLLWRYPLLLFRLRGRELVIAGGMPRSGSTWLYTVALELLKQRHGDQLSTTWVGKAFEVIPGNCLLLKTHEADPVLDSRADRVLYSFRDPRDAMLSGARIFDVPMTIETCRGMIAEDRQWRRHASHVMRYETMLADPPAEVLRIAAAMNEDLDAGRAAAIHEAASFRKPKREEEREGNLYHREHRTGTRTGEWRDVFPRELQQEITREFGGWLEENDYPTS